MTSTKANYDTATAELFPTLQDEVSRAASRSPHPYHRRSSSLKISRKSITNRPVKYSESTDSTESEERGTEADDEKGPILKGLPAPPLRGRKGLKGSKTPADLTPSVSPFPTPPAVTDRRLSYFSVSQLRKSGRLDTGTSAQASGEYQKYVRRRRAEIARRGTEIVLLALTGYIASREALSSGRLEQCYHELSTSCVTLGSLYLLFPLHIVLERYRSGSHLSTAFRAGFHIPSRFDPGQLLYPVFLPFFISVSLLPAASEIVVANIVLGLSSLPSRLLLCDNVQIAESVHWILSLAPIVRGPFSPSNRATSGAMSHLLRPEDIALLFPFHHATLTTLKFLTSTSLDPAEIQLLSTGLVDLYLFAASPQSEILKALLWVGALCLFIFCQKPLSWEVRLARIPSWKFARNKSPRTGLLSVCENILNMLLPQHRYRQLQDLGSDDEDYEHLKSARRMVKIQNRLRRARTGGAQSELDTISSEKEGSAIYNGVNGLQRSLTVSAATSYPNTAGHRRKHLSSTTNANTGFLSLTYAQAQACKWLISYYVFITVAALILVVVRHYVSMQALGSHEPFGWAIGYLFGNIQPLRLWVVSNNLEMWISLPAHRIHNVLPSGSGWIEEIRQTQLGPANTRLVIAAYCVVILIAGIGSVLQLGKVAEVDTRRKVFHGTMVAMLLPTIFVDPCFVSLALSLILAIFLLLDLFRASQLPPVSKPLTTFLAPYVDGRDYRGPVIVSHIFLLIGCAIPLWLSLAAAPRTGEDPWAGWDTQVRELSMISGVVCVGMGDAAASLIGRRYGRTKWFWGGGKSLEGSFAFAAAVTAGLAASYVWLCVGGWDTWDTKAFMFALSKMALAGTGASVLESVLTAGNDNVIVPIGLWLLTRGLGI